MNERIVVCKGEGYTARVHIPIFSEEEETRRVNEIKKALAQFARETLKK